MLDLRTDESTEVGRSASPTTATNRKTSRFGLDLRDPTVRGSVVAPGTRLLGCDLRATDFAGADLNDVVFRGCRLDGASFANAVGTSTYVYDCFVTDGPRPIFDGHQITNLVVTGGNVRESHWSPETQSALADALSPDSSVAHDGLTRLAGAGDPSISSCLVPVLSSPDRGVRHHVLKVLLGLRGDGFAGADMILLETMTLLLADESAEIRQHVVDLVKNGLLERYVRLVLDRVHSPHPSDRRLALRAAITLARSHLAQSVPLDEMSRAVEDSDPEVRGLAIELQAIATDSSASRKE